MISQLRDKEVWVCECVYVCVCVWVLNASKWPTESKHSLIGRLLIGAFKHHLQNQMNHLFTLLTCNISKDDYYPWLLLETAARSVCFTVWQTNLWHSAIILYSNPRLWPDRVALHRGKTSPEFNLTSQETIPAVNQLKSLLRLEENTYKLCN